MKPETITLLTKLLRAECERRKGQMMSAIHMQYSDSLVKERIGEYQEAYSAEMDFSDWLNELEEEAD